MRGRGRKVENCVRELNQVYSDSSRRLFRKWTLFSVWNPSQLQRIFTKTHNNKIVIPIFRHDFVDILKTSFKPFPEDNDLQLDLKSVSIVLKVTGIGIKKEDEADFSDQPLLIKTQELKFRKLFGRENPGSSVTLVCHSPLAEFLNVVISQSDVLIISGNNLALNQDKEVYLNLNCCTSERLQVIRIPFFEEDSLDPFLLIEKVKPSFRDVLTYKYMAMNPQTKFRFVTTKHRIFDVERQISHMNDPSANVYDIRNPEFFQMPINKYMSPMTIFTFLIYCNSNPNGILEAVKDDEDEDEYIEDDEDEDEYIKDDTMIFKSIYSAETCDTYPKWSKNCFVIVCLGLLAYLGYCFFNPLSVSVDGDLPLLQKSDEETQVSVLYDFQSTDMFDSIIKWKNWLLGYIVNGFDFLCQTIQITLSPITSIIKKSFAKNVSEDDAVINESGLSGWTLPDYGSLLQNIVDPGPIMSTVIEKIWRGIMNIFDSGLGRFFDNDLIT